jgi:hypothetical protein
VPTDINLTGLGTVDVPPPAEYSTVERYFVFGDTVSFNAGLA